MNLIVWFLVTVKAFAKLFIGVKSQMNWTSLKSVNWNVLINALKQMFQLTHFSFVHFFKSVFITVKNKIQNKNSSLSSNQKLSNILLLFHLVVKISLDKKKLET